MKYFDAHCHVQFDAFAEDRQDVLERMQREGVGGLIVGVDRRSSEGAVAVANGQTLFASIGLHPNDKPDEGYDDGFFRALAESPNVVAIGECGLDYYRPEDPGSEKSRQTAAFAAQIALAGELRKPLMIHARPSKGSMDAYDDAYDMLVAARQKYPELTGNMHFFVGDLLTARKFVDIGFTLSYTAVLTFTNDYDEVIRAVPLENLLSETDAPYIAPAGLRGKRNEPTAVMEVVSAIARIREEDEEKVRVELLANAERVFSLKF